jgi:hypothetical protein
MNKSKKNDFLFQNIDKLKKSIGKVFQNNISQNNKSVGVKAHGN